MGLQLDNITAAPDCSLTFIMGDIGRGSRQAQGEVEAWLNALARQSVPIVASKTGRAQLEAWLDLAEEAGLS